LFCLSIQVFVVKKTGQSELSCTIVDEQH